MQYKMQFTVLDDAVKQNRKLPEIAFFDTDGNLIHLGGGGEGSSVDLAHLTELGFGSPTDVTLARLVSEDIGATALRLSQPLIIDESGHNGLYVVDTSDTDFWNEGGELYPGGATVWNQESGSSGMSSAAGFYTEGLLGSPAAFRASIKNESVPRYQVEFDGSLHWGDGTAASDVTLERAMWDGLFTNIGLVVADADPAPDYFTPYAIIGRGHVDTVGEVSGGRAFSTAVAPAPGFTFEIDNDGSMHWGAGAVWHDYDTSLQRTAPGTLEIDHTLSFKGDASDPLSGATITWDQDEYGLTVEGLPGSGGTWFQVKNPDYAEAAYVSSGSIGVGGPYGGEVAASGGNRAAKLYAESEGAGLRVMSTVGIPDASEFPIIGTLCFPHIGGSNDYGWSVPFTIDFNGAIRWSDPTNYTADQDPFSHTTDVTLQRAAAGVLEIPQHGGGFKLTSPDGSQTKTVRLSNAGALELV